MLLSLQGCMAVGKTTAAKTVQAKNPDIWVSLEDTQEQIHIIKSQNLDKTNYEDYLKIQTVWIDAEIRCFEQTKQYACRLFDFGAEEIEFYTHCCPKSKGLNWETEKALQKKLNQLKLCMPQRILFLDANEEILKQRKQNDTERQRGFFEHYLNRLLPLKKQWFSAQGNVDWLDTSYLTKEETAQAVEQWIRKQQKRNGV